MRTFTSVLSVAALLFVAAGCSNSTPTTPESGPDAQAPTTEQAAVPAVAVRAPSGTETFTLSWSYYTSWSALVAAEEYVDIDGRKGWMGTLETKHGVDIVLQRDEYVNTFGLYGSGQVDAITMTNTDALGVAGDRLKNVKDASVAVFPTSYSHGADRLIVHSSIADFAGLAGTPLHAEEFSVTHYLLYRACQENGAEAQFNQPGGYTVEHTLTVEGVKLMATNPAETKAYGGWPPEVLVVEDRQGANTRVAFDSSQLAKYEITDLVVVGKSVLDTERGQNGVRVLAEAMDLMVTRLQSSDSSESKDAYRAVSAKFAGADPSQIERALTISTIFAPSASAVEVLNSPEMRANMPKVDGFTQAVGIASTSTPYAWAVDGNTDGAVFIFDPSSWR